MDKFFKVTGYIILVTSIIEFFMVATYNVLLGVLTSLIAFALGLAFITISNLINRVDFLERHMKASYEGTYGNEDRLPQKKCPNCGKFHDFDYPACPHCKYKYYPDA